MTKAERKQVNLIVEADPRVGAESLRTLGLAGQAVCALVEPYDVQHEAIAFGEIGETPEAITHARSLSLLSDEAQEASGFSVSPEDYAPIMSRQLTPGFVQYTTNPDSPDMGIILTPWDTAVDEDGDPKRLKLPLEAWQPGPMRVMGALAARAYEFDLHHNPKIYERLRGMMRGAELTEPRPKQRSPVIEELLRIRHREPRDEAEADRQEAEIAEILGSAAPSDLAYARTSSDRVLSRKRAAENLFVSNGIAPPSSFFGLGGIPWVTGSSDVLATAALSFMRSYISRNNIFAGNFERQLALFEEAKRKIEKLNLPPDMFQLVLSQIGISIGSENRQQEVANAQRAYDAGCRLIRNYSTNPDRRGVETMEAVRQALGGDVTLAYIPIVDLAQAHKLVHPDIQVDILGAGHGGGENCTSLGGGGAHTGIELAYGMYLDSAFDNALITLEGGTGDSIGPLMGIVDCISMNKRGVAGGIEVANGLRFSHVSGKKVQPYHGSASAITQWTEAALNAEIAARRITPSGLVGVVEGVPNYAWNDHWVRSIVDRFQFARILAGRTLADQDAQSISEMRKRVAVHGFDHRHITSASDAIAKAHPGSR